ncbi:MAG: bifunctional phosphopantothenoylcysteine decarboxylase/phosphopantothenate--cysteine ligase CoaBC [Elusimicrobiota bacterium]|jgi:phosphopantothenoylcysteine decarboxylase/phosphopantothenate--cysteine ligase|nr:bifunctional phosphopantothenoylcysteine decarboxylase/phosphopantothenate--cysteine ligase CoaBC [Elusimicrobiota bacterium]
MNTLTGKNVIVGISGSIAAYKACEIVRLLVKEGANVDCIMTQNACNFIRPLTLETLSRNKVHIEMFEQKKVWNIEHIGLAQKADLFLIAPATADTISRLAAGRSSDLLTSTALSTTAKIIICPAMNTNMYNHKATQKNIEALKSYGYEFISPESGELACGQVGDGRLCAPSAIVSHVKKCLS